MRIAKEVEAHELRNRKELEKQDILRRKVLFFSPKQLFLKHSSSYADILNFLFIERGTNEEGNGKARP